MKGKRTKGFLVFLAIAVMSLIFGSFAEAASDYPNRTITIICPFAAGGGVDVTSRIWGKYAEKILGQTVVVDNRTGGGGVIGHTAGAQAAPDGYTLTMITTGVLWQHLTGRNVAFTPDSFVPAAQITFDPNVLIVKTGSKADMKVKEFINYVKQNPSQLTMGVGGRWASQDMARGLLQIKGGLLFNPVFFDGGAQAMTNLLAGNIDVGFAFQTEFGSHVNAGTMKVIASASSLRHPFLPDSPTLKESGIDVVAGTWRAIAVPKGTPDDIVKKLTDITEQIMKNPEARADFSKAFIIPDYLGTGDFMKVYKADEVSYADVVSKLK